MGKRVFDIVLALALALPALLIVAVAAVPVWIEGRAFPLFLQPRVGRHRRIFRIVKLRTMYADTVHTASHEVAQQQIMRTGALMRKYKVDELPQIFNVLRGDMSFVGPRPCLPTQLELIDAREATGVYELSPGITGVAQVQGLDMSHPKELAETDAGYRHPWSLRRDLRLIARTISGGGRADAAMRPR